MVNNTTGTNMEIIKHFDEIEDINLKREIALGVMNNLIGYLSPGHSENVPIESLCYFLDRQTKAAETGDIKYLY